MLSVDEVKELVQQVVSEANRLGLTWTIKLATVVASSLTGGLAVVVVDGDTVPIRVSSMVGVPPAGARVYVICTPPAGNYIVGYAYRPGKVITDSQWATGALTGVTNTFADITGATVTFTAYSDNASVEILGSFDMNWTTLSAGILASGRCLVDGVEPVVKQAVSDGSTVNRKTVSLPPIMTTVTRGQHVAQLQARKTAAAGVLDVAGNTTISVKVME